MATYRKVRALLIVAASLWLLLGALTLFEMLFCYWAYPRLFFPWLACGFIWSTCSLIIWHSFFSRFYVGYP